MKPVYEAWRNRDRQVEPAPAAGLPRPMRISAIQQENAQTRTLELEGQLAAAPGQFVMAWLPEVGERPLSLAGDNPVRLTIASVGPFSQAVHSLRAGDRLWLRGPLGQGYRVPQPPGHALLIGGGYGVAPLRFLALRLRDAGHSVSLIIGARRAEDLLLTDAVRERGVALWITTEDGSAGSRGLVTDLMAPAIAAGSQAAATVFACGPNGMLRAISAICQEQRLPCQLSWEAPMRCGIGLCGSCEVGAGWLACLDGPVFDFDPQQTAPWDRRS